jgi:hypothetical protein
MFKPNIQSRAWSSTATKEERLHRVPADDGQSPEHFPVYGGTKPRVVFARGFLDSGYGDRAIHLSMSGAHA